MPRERTGGVNWNRKREYWEARLDWTDENGKKHCRKRRVENKTEGKQLVSQWKREIEDKGSEYLHADRITFQHLADLYGKEKLIPPVYKDGVKVIGLRDWRGQRNRLAALVAYFGSKKIRSITAADLERYRAQRLQTQTEKRKSDRSVADVNRSLALLRAVLNFGLRAGWLARNPFSMTAGIVSTAQEVTRTRILSTDEQRRLLRACQDPFRQHIYPLVLVALDSGARHKELITLRWQDVDLANGKLVIRAENAKTNIEREIDLEPITLTELHKLRQQSLGQPGDLVFGVRHNFRKAWHSAMKKAGIHGARFHDLRATAITTWLLRGLLPQFAMRRSGHTEPKTFLRYVRMSDQIRQKQREQLSEWELAEGLATMPAPTMAAEMAECSVSEMVN